MRKINCRIISVNVEDKTVLDSIKVLGYSANRYISRRKIVNEFVNSIKDDRFKVEIFNAITPNQFKLENKKDVVFFENNLFTVAERSELYIANILSHYKIWQMQEDTLILEDDIIFNRTIFSNVHNILSNLNIQKLKNVILYLQISRPSCKLASDKLMTCSSLINEQVGYTDSLDVSGTGAYYISRECKETILSNMQDLRACDNYLDRLRHLGIIKICIPFDKNNMFKLNTDLHWLL